MNRHARIQPSTIVARSGGRSWCACLFVLLLAAASTLLAQTSADSAVDPVTSAAQQGDAAAQVKLGLRYYDGAGRQHPPDYAEALKWFQRGAEQGNADAQNRIGMMYYQGEGVPQDYAEAARWYLLAAHAGNEHAQRQLIEMYSRGLGVPRDLRESKKWVKVLNTRHPDKMTAVVWVLFAVGCLAVLAFSIALAALQRHALYSWRRLAAGIFVHAAGIALVLNSLTTYGFWLVFPHCSHNFLATACTQISDPHTRKVVNEIGDWAVVNLIFRFMAGIGLALDILAAWYVVYLCQLLFRRTLRPARPEVAPNVQTNAGC
jgi:hypothetical protein